MTNYRARFFYDWGSGVWLWSASDETRARFGYPIDHHAIGLSDEMADLLDELGDRYDTALNWAEPNGPGPLRTAECDEINAAARHARATLRQQLEPDWEIVDEYGELSEDPGLDLYEHDRDEYWRQRLG